MRKKKLNSIQEFTLTPPVKNCWHLNPPIALFMMSIVFFSKRRVCEFKLHQNRSPEKRITIKILHGAQYRKLPRAVGCALHQAQEADATSIRGGAGFWSCGHKESSEAATEKSFAAAIKSQRLQTSRSWCGFAPIFFQIASKSSYL